MIATTRAWLVNAGGEWRIHSEPIKVSGYAEELARGIALTMVRIPAGAFLMSSPQNEAKRKGDEGPQHRVALEGFHLARTPVTQAQWREVAGWPKVEVELNANSSRFQGATKPVERVSWEAAMEFCRRLSRHTGRAYTLPSEAQWEYACRAGTTTPFAFGETLTTELNSYNGNGRYADGPRSFYRGQTTEVDRFPANGWGLHDMHGNVWEWCLDLDQASYAGAPTDGRARLTGWSDF